jgi:tryptophan halogenase
MLKNIVVVGGGTAGWLTALFAKHLFKNSSITLIESKTIGILGAGEGTTPSIISFLSRIGIDPYDLIVKTKGSIKQGISFENWNGDNKKYFHEFTAKNRFNNFSFLPIFSHDCYHYYIKNMISQKKDLTKYLYPAILSYKDKIDIKNVSFALHFDAVHLAEFLKNIALARGINRIEEDVFDVELNEKGFVEKIITKNKKVNVDFVFDCSGFKRLIIGKKYKTKWISYKKWLPMDSAIAFPMSIEDKVNPYTSAIAMKNGWIWKIPLQHRYGSGYVYDSNYINEQEALDEASNFFNKKLEIVNRFKFEAGRYENIWVNNCISIGLSSGFTEPLEATSLWLSTSHLEMLAHYLETMKFHNKKIVENFNIRVRENNDNVRDFIFYHYLTKRNDSLFWKDFKKNKFDLHKEIPLINNFINNENSIYDFTFQKGIVSFGIESHYQVGHGLDLLEIKKENWFDYQRPSIEDYFKTVNTVEKFDTMDHRQFLNRMNNGQRFF